MPVITISREYGSGGVEIAQHICETLGYTYFDKNLMVRVAGEMGISEDNVVDVSEDTYRMRSFLERLVGRNWLRSDVGDTGETSEPSLRLETLNEEEGIQLVRDTVLGAYAHGNVVIVGRGGQAILRERPGVLHVRLNAPRGARALRVKEREDSSLSEATQMTHSRDQSAVAYLRRFFDVEWENPRLYHLTLNTGKWDLMDAAEIIMDSLTHLRHVREL